MFASFARAAAERYPWVRNWIVWNEPNQRRWLTPPSPVLYVTRLLNPAAEAIKGVIPRASIAGGATAPRGGPGGMSPVDFIRGMGRAGARLDAYAHHPHPLSPAETPSAGACDHCSTISMAIARAPPHGDAPRVRVAHSHLADGARVPDEPARPGPRRRLGTQARFVAEAQHRAYRAAGVDVLIQYLLRDEPATSAWQSGLETVSGRVKPSMSAFSLPLVQVVRRGAATTVWGQVRPGTGARPYVLQRLVGENWAAVGSGARTTARGYLTRTVRADKGRAFASTTRPRSA